MLKRLIIAVLALGLVLSLSGTAFSGESTDRHNGLERVSTINPNATKSEPSVRPAIPSQRADMNDPSEVQPLFKSIQKPVSPLPAGYFCSALDNSGTFWDAAYGLPGGPGGIRTSLAERFFADAGIRCTVKGTYAYTHTFYFSGSPSIMFYLYDDDGFGLPGVKLDSVLISNACLIDSSGGCLQAARPDPLDSGFIEMHVLFPNGPWVFEDMDAYHIAVERVGVGGLAIIGDAGDSPFAGEKRGSVYRTDLPGWIPSLSYFGTDRNFTILAEVCCAEIPYSDCYSQTYWQNFYSAMRVPHPAYGEEAWAVRFSVTGPETLKSVDFYTYVSAASPGVNAIVSVYPDDGSGFPLGYPSSPLASVVVPNGSLVDFPAAVNADFSSFNLVFESDFHVVLTSDGVPGSTFMRFLLDDGTSGIPRASVYWAGNWYTPTADGWASDMMPCIDANMCKDQFAICSIDNDNYESIDFQLRLPRPDAGYGITRYAQQFLATGGESCKPKEVTIYFSWASGSADQFRTLYDSTVYVDIYGDVAGMPGTFIARTSITPADFIAAGNVGWTGGFYYFGVTENLEPLNVSLSGPFWIVLENSSPSFSIGGARPLMDADGTANSPINGSAIESTENPGWATEEFFWGNVNGVYAGAALLIDLKVCCSPFPEYACQTPQDWGTAAGNFQRTGRSDVSLSDAFCDMNLRWNYTDLGVIGAEGIVYAAPVVYKGRVMQVWQRLVRQFDIVTGAVNFTLGPGAPYGNDMRCTPSATTIDIAGTPTDVAFLVTGGSGTGRAMVCVNWTTGATIWSVLGPNGAGGGLARWGITSVANQAGTDVVYHCTEIGRVVARVAATGALFSGWTTNPIVLAEGASEATNTYNPTDNLLYFGTRPASGNGDFYAINAATGAIAWQLSSAGGLQGASIWLSNNGGDTLYIPTAEGFSMHAAYEAGVVYMNSRSAGIGNSHQFPADGVFYKLNAATGSIIKAVMSQATYYSAPILDANAVIIPSRSNWGSAWNGGDLVSFDKNFALVNWAYDHATGQGNYMPGLITCEPNGAADQIFLMGQRHFMVSVDANSGSQLWTRRFDYGNIPTANSKGAGVAMSKDGELVISDEGGGIAVLAKGADRQRMQFLTYRPGGNVSFGPNPALPMNLGWFMKNDGCIPLNITGVTVGATSPTGGYVPVYSPKPEGVGTNLLTVSSSIADKMAASKWNYMINDDGATEIAASREVVNTAALAAPPAWWVSLEHPTVGDVIMPGDSMMLEITINQPMLSRGPQYAYVAYNSDDPDFFLNDAAKAAEARVTLIGGCLNDTTDLSFGMGGANYQHVFNTGKLGATDFGDDGGVNGEVIDGNETTYFSGAYIYAVSRYRWAIQADDPWSNVFDNWISLQGDPNWCDNSCKPALVSPYPVPAITNDGGLTYTPITASMVCRSYLDSVQNFDPGDGSWDSRLYSAAPFDNDSTMGLWVTSHVVGAIGVPELANVTVDIMEFKERNGRDVPNWAFGSHTDYDLTGGDTSGLDRSVSAAYDWSKTSPSDGVWGYIKLPFGCGQTPMVNVKGLISTQSMAAGGGNPGSNAFFDSVYFWLSRPPGTHISQKTSTGDFRLLATYAQKNILANESFTIGVAQFGFTSGSGSATGSSAPPNVKNLAHMVNKWTGWGRGDVNNDKVINLADVVYLGATVNFSGPGAVPFEHLGDVNASGGAPDQADVDYLINFYFGCGPCPAGAWTM